MDGEAEVVSVDEAKAGRIMKVEEVLASLDQMHKDVFTLTSGSREKRVNAHNAKTHVRKCNFDIGDFVLRGMSRPEKATKLRFFGKGLIEWPKYFRISYLKSRI